jgi:hypothetical protein
MRSEIDLAEYISEIRWEVCRVLSSGADRGDPRGAEQMGPAVPVKQPPSDPRALRQQGDRLLPLSAAFACTDNRSGSQACR